jgi:hypothetical protein
VSASGDDDDDLVQDYTRVRLDEGTFVIEAAVVAWQGPHSPEVSWIEATRLPSNASSEELDRVRRGLLQRRRFFVVCKGCGKRHAKGHTDEGVCHGCMEKSGVVF